MPGLFVHDRATIAGRAEPITTNRERRFKRGGLHDPASYRLTKLSRRELNRAFEAGRIVLKQLGESRQMQHLQN